MIEQAVGRCDYVRWRGRRGYDSIFDQTEEVTQSAYFRFCPLARPIGGYGPPDAGLQLGALLLGDEVKHQPPTFALSEQHIEVDHGPSNSSEIAAFDATAEDCIQHRQDTGIQEASELSIRE